MEEYADSGDFKSPKVLDAFLCREDESVILDNWARMFVGLSKVIPISKVVHIQYAQANTNGACSVPFSRAVTASGAVHTGQLKQFLEHL